MECGNKTGREILNFFFFFFFCVCGPKPGKGKPDVGVGRTGWLWARERYVLACVSGVTEVVTVRIMSSLLSGAWFRVIVWYNDYRGRLVYVQFHVISVYLLIVEVRVVIVGLVGV